MHVKFSDRNIEHNYTRKHAIGIYMRRLTVQGDGFTGKQGVCGMAETESAPSLAALRDVPGCVSGKVRPREDAAMVIA